MKIVKQLSEDVKVEGTSVTKLTNNVCKLQKVTAIC